MTEALSSIQLKFRINWRLSFSAGKFVTKNFSEETIQLKTFLKEKFWNSKNSETQQIPMTNALRNVLRGAKLEVICSFLILTTIRNGTSWNGKVN